MALNPNQRGTRTEAVAVGTARTAHPEPVPTGVLRNRGGGLADTRSVERTPHTHGVLACTAVGRALRRVGAMAVGAQCGQQWSPRSLPWGVTCPAAVGLQPHSIRGAQAALQWQRGAHARQGRPRPPRCR